jgi:hypothetical protein
MDTNVHRLQARLDTLEQRCQRAERHLKTQAGLAFLVVVAAILIAPTSRIARAQGSGNTLDMRVTALETKTQFMRADARSHATVFSGCNVFIQNGLGATNGLPGDPTNTDPTKTKTNGLGNLIVGYNESRGISLDIRTGSHNIIGGAFQNYSSFGGMVTGHDNTITGIYATVSGGDGNQASGPYAVISGGAGNLASGGYASSISGGGDNIASGLVSWVGGGANNLASRTFTSVSGGDGNQASGEYASVSGGDANLASGGWASVSGGALNIASSSADSISGGRNNRTNNFYSSISGGTGITQSNISGWSAGNFHTP